MTRKEVEAKFFRWANARDLPIETINQWDDKAHHALVVDDSGDSYQLYAGPNPKDVDYPNANLALVGVTLLKRGDKRYRAFSRERARFTFEQLVPLANVDVALDTALDRAKLWISEASHTFELPQFSVGKHDDA